MSESLKAYDDLLNPDGRSAIWVRVNARTGERQSITLEDYHKSAAAIVLNATVPEHIEVHFLTARHLAIYSWFVYRFTMVAQMQAYATLEFALRERFGYSKANKPPAFRKLLDRAISENLLRDEAFRDWPQRGMSVAAGTKPWVSNLPEVITGFRNELAHGSQTLAPMHFLVLRIVADAINQLYPETETGTA